QLPFNPGGLNFTYGTELVRFDRDLDEGYYRIDVDNPTLYPRPDTNIRGLARATGDRFHAEPGISLPMNRSWGFMTPTVKGLYTKYDLDLDGKGQQYITQNQPWLNYDSSPDRSLTLA
ncbi:LPS-assembly protein LptD, partial [Pseudomonas sp. ATCC 13867]